MATGIAGDTPVVQTITNATNNADLLDQILNELRTITNGVYSGLNVVDEPDSFRYDPSNSNPNLN